MLPLLGRRRSPGDSSICLLLKPLHYFGISMSNRKTVTVQVKVVLERRAFFRGGGGGGVNVNLNGNH